jgi:ATP-dependent DNA helicase RecQ
MIARTLFLDLETDLKGAHISKAGMCIESLNGGTAWSWKEAQPQPWLCDRLDEVLFQAVAIAGHNLWRHDLPVLAKQFPTLVLLEKLPVVDTLELSPLCFPRNPYHALEKDYKPTGREENDPLGDAVLARQLLRRESEVLAELRGRDPELHRAMHGLCTGGSGRLERGCALVFGGPTPRTESVIAAVRACAGRNGCQTAAARIEIPAAREERMGLAYVLAWLAVAGDCRSVLPGWVWRQFPSAQEFAAVLRDRPCSDPACAWCRAQFDASSRLHRWFPGFQDFRTDEDGRSRQREIVEAALAGKSLIAILPTGGGKSLCFQLPALARMERRGALTIVISPLQSLMKDQVDQLARRVPAALGCAAALNGLLSPLERREVLHRIAMGDVSLLYVAPEQLRSKSFVQAVRQREIGAWVFDEAHCLSKWGHDFRTDYLYAGRFIRERMGAPVPPVMYVTATAKAEVLAEIRAFHEAMTGSCELGLFEASVERPGLRFEVVKVPPGFERLQKISEILSERLGSYGRGGAIVFRATRAKTRETAEFLQSTGWKAAHFHAGLPPEEKKEVQDRFIAGDLQVIAATNAFGMGVDKEDVRVVIHGDMPGSVENYLQEAGRAGRDRRAADCILLFDDNDADWQFSLNGMNRLGRREIGEILRALRKYKRKDGESLVVTVGELMRDTRLQEVFEEEDPSLHTKFKTAISWLERAKFLTRDDNVTSVFQAKPIAQTRLEAELRATELGQPPARQKLWGDILNEFVFARADQGIDADRLVALESLETWRKLQPLPRRANSLLFEELRAMSKAKVLRECTAMTAYVRHKVADPTHARLERLARAEERLLAVLAEQGAPAQEELVLDLALVNQRLQAEGGDGTSLHDLERMAMALAGLEENGKRPVDIRPGGATLHRVRLNVEMPEVLSLAARRRETAAQILETILTQIPAEAAAGKDVLAEFTMDQLCSAAEAGSLFRTGPVNAAAAVERSLLWLHDLQIIRLQRGLALFRSAMTIRVTAETARPYGVKEYAPLGLYYEEKTFQVHVMLEYAQLGLQGIQAALALVLDYFRLENRAFIERYFPGRKKELERAATAEAYRRVVEELGDEEQRRVVEASEEENLLVLAGPGSGKTKTVVHRIAWLLKIRHVPAQSILALCFNHDAAVQLRRRLRELAGAAARGVTVMTYHALAMRLTGTSFRALADRAAAGKPTASEVDFSRPIRAAIGLLKGQSAADPGERNEARDRMLAGFRFILVDEYQDVDDSQYDLISALAGRTLQDPDAKLGLLAVGDDDQSIYGFRGADVRFIRRFEQDYEAGIYGLTSNYRSTAAILAAAGRIIAGNRHRMKADMPLHVDRRRKNDPPGEAVCLIAAAGLPAQTCGLVRQVKAWRAAGVDWDDMAVLGVNHEDLDAFRSVAEAESMPLNVRVVSETGRPGSGLPPLWRMREAMMLLETLHALAGKPVNRPDVQRALADIRFVCGQSHWADLLADAVTAFPEEIAVAEEWIEHLHEHLAGSRRDGRMGTGGIWLSTIHAAKGTEHGHVAVAGAWKAHGQDHPEEARRLLYVSMTRAKRALAVVDRTECPAALLRPLREAPEIAKESSAPPVNEPVLKTYRVLGPADFDLGFAGRGDKARVTRIAEALRKVRAGDCLNWVEDSAGILLRSGRCTVAMLSLEGSKQFRTQADQVEAVHVRGVYGWRKQDVQPEWRNTYTADRWGVPLCEVVLQGGRVHPAGGGLT